MKVVEIKKLNKSFSGIKAVKDLSFSVTEGEILGLIGPNGAGKSTTIKTILDFIKPDSGEVMLFGSKILDSTKNDIGYLPEEKGLYKKLSAIELIHYLASLKGMSKKHAQEKALQLLQKTGMLEHKKKKIEEMSKGMGQMIQFIVTIIHDPKLIILDEPFSGLDPVNTNLMKNILLDLKKMGKAIFLSTHQMNEVEELCDRVLMINNGSAVLYGDLDEIKSKYRGHSVYVNAEGKLNGIKGVEKMKEYKDFIELTLDKKTESQDILEQLVNQKVKVNHFEIATPSLNDIFLKIVSK